jgi:hypothetical protein
MVDDCKCLHPVLKPTTVNSGDCGGEQISIIRNTYINAPPRIQLTLVVGEQISIIRNTYINAPPRIQLTLVVGSLSFVPFSLLEKTADYLRKYKYIQRGDKYFLR